ncbi:AAA family ATPase [Pedococcus bigeumensis]|uniref:AAA family ATPase n=1 Tax=Pedococcus bigeumensis TaxID=433644 RepID=UPI002FEBCD4A
MTVDDLDTRLEPYLPVLLRGPVPAEPVPAHWALSGSLVVLDISGFTRLTERLAARGRAGAEELSDVLDDVFGPLVETALAEGCDLLKWGGDAVLLLAAGAGSAVRATRAAARMRAELSRVGHLRTSVGAVVLRASTGVATGDVHLVLAGDPAVHRELMVLGPLASRVTALEAAASAGQVLVDAATAALLPERYVGEATGPGFLLRGLPPVTTARAATPLAAAPPVATAPPAHTWIGTRDGGQVPDLGTLLPQAVGGATTDRAGLVPGQLRAHVEHGNREPEHRVAAAAFVRFSGTDALVEEEGPEALTLAIDQLVRTIQEATTRHGVSFHETDIDVDGGKVMLVAGAPQSTGDDVDHLLAAVRHVVDRPGRLPVRVGVAQGRVFTGDLGPASRRTYSVKGGAVNLAARLAARAAPGSISLPAELLDHSRTRWEVESAAALRLKGLAEPVSSVTLGRATSRLAEQAETAMVGREVELGQIRTALDRLGDGQGGLVTVVGQPGMGKTRLVEEVLAGAEDFVVLKAECGHSGATAPYATVRILLAAALGLSSEVDPQEGFRRAADVVGARDPQLLGMLPMLGLVFDVPLRLPLEGQGDDSSPDPGDGRGPSSTDQPVGHAAPEVAASGDYLGEEFRSDALHRLVVAVMEAALQTPTLLVVEDAHLMDGDSARVLEQLAARCEERPWLLLTTRRALDDSRPVDGLVVVLGPLGASASELMTELVDPERPLPPAAARALVARAGGHPLFIRELVLAAARGDRIDDLPLSVEELVAVQIDSLAPRQRSLLRRAAVLGDSFTLALLAELVADLPEGRTLRDDVAELSAFLEPAGTRRWQFRHAVHRETAYAGLPIRVRTSLHGTVGEVLSRSPRVRSRRPEVLAHHFFAAGRFADAWECARRAGAKALGAAAPEAAAHAYAQAAEAALRSGSVPSVERAADLESWGDALFLCGRSGDADRAYAQARHLWMGEPVRSAALSLKAAKVAQRQGRHPVALRRTATGLRILDGAEGPDALAARARLLSRRSVVLMSQGRYAQAAQCAHEAVQTAEHAGQDDALAQAHLVLHGVEVFTGSSSGMDHGETALALYAGLGDLSGQAHAHNNIAMRLLLQGRWTEALEGFQRAAASFEKVGDAANAANAAYNSADLLNRQGRPRAALDVLAGVLRIAKAVDDEELRALVLREQGRAHHRAGRPDEGARLLDEARSVFHALHEPHEVCETDVAVAEGHLLAGRSADALAATQRVLATITTLGAATLLPSALRVRASAQAVLGQVSDAWVSLRDGLAASAAPDLAHERGFLLAVRAHLESVDLADHEASVVLERLGVLRAPLPWLSPVGQDELHHG